MNSIETALRGGPKYLQVKRILEDKLLKLPIEPGRKLWTEAELIDSLGVSATPIRRALDEMVREGVLVRQAGKGTFLKRLPNQKTDVANRTVLLLAWKSWSDLHHDVYYRDIVESLDQTLRERNFQLMSLMREWEHNPQVAIDDIRRYEPAALIFPYSQTSSKSLILRLKTLGVPVLLINQHFRNFAGSQIYFDDHGGGAMAAKYLIDKGHRRVAVISGPNDSPASSERVLGFLDVMKKHDTPVSSDRILSGIYNEDGGYQLVDAIMKKNHPPTAIFCCSDLMAYGAIVRLKEMGLSVPDDVAVMGFGDFKVSQRYYPNLTTVRMNLVDLGKKSGRWISDVLDGREHHTEEVKPVEEKLSVEIVVGDTA